MSAPLPLPLVLVPGYMLDETLWDALLPALAAADAVANGGGARRARHAGTASGVAGAGAPGENGGAGAARVLWHVPLGGGVTIAGMAQAALEQAPEGQFDLLGFSMGGYVAREITRLAPHRVRSLILVATSSRAESPQRASQRQAAALAKPIGPFRGLGRAAIAQSLHPLNANDEALVEQIRTMGERLGRATFVEQSLIVRDSDAGQLAQIQCPTLVIAGAQDQMRSVDESRELAAGIPGAKLEIIQDSGHMIPLEQPARLAHLISTWP